MSPIHITPCTLEQIQHVLEGVNAYNLQQVPALADLWTPLEFVATDNNGNTLGGVLGGVGYWNGLEIKVLWVSEDYRHQGIGGQLMAHIEQMAQAKGATLAMLDTFDFQAKDFYLKQGYNLVGTIDNFPKGHQRYYFSKSLG
ncbi:GNAT family N-acetyltransferase [Microscilla marina]|uniref:Acetyltransferase n=1 Tax=Microscilla marina ATCC 23134 TaxID=313606 RepID=A1ZMB3_MICM2|nr:GNAT family N-acetyltransferase [Microscilla marina]EAY28293.1 acetyltransferase [Microscilla marina ATCC 23134]